jgi:peptidoglycan/xylan/chitin deacetylase (PgdA/CDA1 family)
MDNPLNQSLGRDRDPKTINDISKFNLIAKKATWSLLSLPGMRNMTKLLFPKSTISYINTNEKVVAFTIDDGFCGKDNPDGDMLKDIIELFDMYDAKATFFVTGSHIDNTLYSDIQILLTNGHELANHSMYDWPYNKYTKQDFEKDFDKTNFILSQFTSNIPKFYRAPHAKISKTMLKFLDERDYKHILCDGFASDTSIPDPLWISKFILKRTKPGSILLIHMPEKNVREWNYKAIELTLKGLKERGYKVVTVSELLNLSLN